MMAANNLAGAGSLPVNQQHGERHHTRERTIS